MLVEDVIDVIVVFDELFEFDCMVLNCFVGVVILFLIVFVIGMVMWVWWEIGCSLWWLLVIGILGIVVLVGSFVVNRFY